MAGIPSRSIEAVCHAPTPAISIIASPVVNLSRISSISTLAKSEGGMAKTTGAGMCPNKYVIDVHQLRRTSLSAITT